MNYLEKKQNKGFEYKSWSSAKTSEGEKVEVEVVMNSPIKLLPPILDLVFTTIRTMGSSNGEVEVQDCEFEYNGQEIKFPKTKVTFNYKAPQWGDDKEKIKLKLQ